MWRGRSQNVIYVEHKRNHNMKTMIKTIVCYLCWIIQKAHHSSYQVQSALSQCLSFHPCDIAHDESRVCVAQPLLSLLQTFRCICSHHSHRLPLSASLSFLGLVCKSKHHNVTTFSFFCFLLSRQNNFD